MLYFLLKPKILKLPIPKLVIKAVYPFASLARRDRCKEGLHIHGETFVYGVAQIPVYAGTLYGKA